MGFSTVMSVDEGRVGFRRDVSVRDVMGHEGTRHVRLYLIFDAESL